MGCGWSDLQGSHQTLPWKNGLADNEARRKTKSHGENLDESAEQEDPEKGASSETKWDVQGHAEQIHRCVSPLRGGVEEVKVVSNQLRFLMKTCVDFVWRTSVLCPRSRASRDNGKTPRPIASSACISVLLLLESGAGRNVLRMKTRGLAATPWRPLPFWRW